MKETDLDAIAVVLKDETAVRQALIFGSRAKGNYRPGSDVDIVLKGENITSQITAHISFLLNDEGLLPYKFDVLNYYTIDNKDLIDHINRVGKIIYSV
ncbi:MAG: nucleotidyltransferase domain-containing protein [Chitinophagaceae bacterium]|nr:nucleotidyltransferase domain-containing protein [Chitinophagaceae bacterium]